MLICFYSINITLNEPLEVAHAHIDDDRYDMDECSASCQLKLDLSNQPRDSRIVSTDAIRMSSANMLLFYQHNVYWAIGSGSCAY